jgi:WD40 repeat protein
VLLVVDQAEEIFAACPDPTRRAAFLSMLDRLTHITDADGRPAACAILALRADFYAAAADEPVLLPALRHAQIVVGAMTRAELTEAIVAPAAAVGLHVEDALVQTLLEELAPRDRLGSAHDRGALPLLAHALHATWLVCRRGRMTVDDYLSTGGIAGAVERTAESVWADLDDESRELARRVFLRLVFVDDESMVTRRRVRVEELHGLESRGGAATDAADRPTVAGVVEVFADARLLTLRTDTVEISHEALIGAWSRLGGWIGADRSVLRLHRQLSEAARTWDQAGHDESYLLRSGRLAVVDDLLDTGRVTLNDAEQAFVDASTVRMAARRGAERRQRVRLRVALAAVAVLALVTSALSVFALRAESSANQRAVEATAARNDAQSRELAIAADRLRDSDPALAAQLALVAFRVSPTVDARSALLDTTALTQPTRIPSQEGPTFVAAARNTAVLAVTQAVDGAVDLWSTATSGSPALLATVPSGQPDVQQFSVAISPDGRQLAAGDAAGLVERWDISDPRHPRQLPGPGVVFPSGVLALAFSPDGRQLAAGGEGGAVQRWTVPDAGAAQSLPKIVAAPLVSSLAWAPDGRMLWIGDDDGGVTGWAVNLDGTVPGADDTSRAFGRLNTGPATVSALAVSPDGGTLAAGTKRGELHLWHRGDDGAWTEAEQPRAPLAGWLDTITFSPDGTDLALGATGNDIRVLDADDLSERAAMVAPGPVTAVTYTSDGELAAGSTDGFTRLWPVPGVVIGPVGDTIFDVAVPGPGRLDVGAAQKIGGLLTYDVSRPADPARTVTPMSQGTDVRLAGILASSPDGDVVAMGAAGGQVQLWDTTDPDRPLVAGPPFAAASDFVDGLAISADGTMLAVGSDAKVVNLWDISDPVHPRPLAQTEDAGGQVASVAFQPGAPVLAAATTGGNVRLWDIDDPAHPKRIANLTGLTGYALSASFSHDGELLAAGGSGREIRIWDVRDPQHITPVGSPLLGPANDIGMVAFDPAGPVLAAGTYGGVVWQWDLSDPAHPKLLAKLRAANGVLYALAWSPDGTTLSAGGSAQKVWTWTTAPEAAAEQICAAAGEGITTSEWSLYVQDRAYDPPCG